MEQGCAHAFTGQGAVPISKGMKGCESLMSGQPQTPQRGGPGPNGHGQPQKGSVVEETHR